MSKLLTITIPSYKQQHLLKRCLSSLRSQTFKEFEVLIIDDQSGDDFSSLIKEYSDLDITVEINPANKGAMKNMFYSITHALSTPYILSLHEDDLLHHQYLEHAVAHLECNPNTAFVASRCVWIEEHTHIDTSVEKDISVKGIELNQTDFVKHIVLGAQIIFGSIVYRSNLVKNTVPDLEQFATLCDRPYLISLLQDKVAVLLDEPHIYVRDHGKKDTRSSTLREYHILNLYSLYKSFAGSYIKSFLKVSTNDVLFSYHTLSTHNMSFNSYIQQAKQKKLLYFSFIRSKGILGIIGAYTGTFIPRTLMSLKRIITRI